MPSFSLVIEYLTGYAVATDPGDRERAEWPPHPARVFMALAAAHFETDPTNTAQRAALEWLAALPDPPCMTVPEHTAREVLTVYVPVNDMEVPHKRTIDGWNPRVQKDCEAILDAMTILPSSRTNKQPRTFPRVHVGSGLLRLTWACDSAARDLHLDVLESICRNVTRIGHSSSLVWVRLERDASDDPTLVPDEHSLERRLRTTQSGALERLESAFNLSEMDEFTALQAEIDSTKERKAKAPLQRKLRTRFPRGRPVSQRPVFSLSYGYRTVVPQPAAAVSSPFDPNFIVLREAHDATQTLGLESTAQLVEALRNLIMSRSKVQPVPPWVGGHESNGDKLTSQNHMALIPLAFVGHDHADGHLMGVGIVVPRALPPRMRAEVLSSILFDAKSNEPQPLELRMGRAGVWKVVRDTDPAPKYLLRTRTYTVPSLSWASVTPVLLDRMPKTDRAKEPIAWREEVAGIVTKSCENVGLPEPVAVRVEKTPYFHGSLRAMPGQGGFPQLRKDKFQVHVALEFDRPVEGPVLLGAGRFRGYGLLRPWKHGEGR